MGPGGSCPSEGSYGDVGGGISACLGQYIQYINIHAHTYSTYRYMHICIDKEEKTIRTITYAFREHLVQIVCMCMFVRSFVLILTRNNGSELKTGQGWVEIISNYAWGISNPCVF